jgi:3-deoxy-manno-octulosonate cytidylyltransferase (CMP-KDO synthetase)
VAFIPSRLQSSRLPRKALVDICGLPMVVHVYRRCLKAKSLDEVYVATDSPEIRDAVVRHGGKAVMTRSDHETGTDRIAEAAAQVDCDIVVNVQGDEALLRPEHVDAVVNGLQADPEAQVALLVNPYRKYKSTSDIKAVLDERSRVMYLSREDIPSGSRTPEPEMLKAYHIVPFRKPFLLQYASWEKGRLERIEFNEYLRILEKGYKILAVKVESSAVSVDTPQDLEYVRKQMATDDVFPTYR